MRRPPKSLHPAAGVLVAGALAAGAPATAQTVAPYVQTAATARPSPTAVIMASRRNAPMIPHGGFARAYPPAEAAATEAPAQGLTPASAWTGPNAPVYQPAPPPYPDARPAPPSWGGRVLSRGPAPAAPWNARPQDQSQDQAKVYSYVDAPAYAQPPVEAPVETPVETPAEAPTAYYAAAPQPPVYQPPAYQPPAPPREVYRDAPIPAPVRERAAPPTPAYAPPAVEAPAQPPVEAPAPPPAPARVADAPPPAPTPRVEPPAVEAPPPPPPVPVIEPSPAPAAEAAPAPAAEAAPAYDPMAPRRDAPIFRLRAQQEAAAAAAAQAEAEARAQAEAQNQAQPPRAAAQGGRRAAAPAPQAAPQAAAPAPTQPQPYSTAPVPPQETARYYSLHRQAGRQPDAAPLPAPTYLNALPVELDQTPASTDLAEPPAAPNLIRNQDGRVRAAPMTDDPDIL